MGQDSLGDSELLTPNNTDNALRGLEYLGGWKNPEGSAAVAQSQIVSFPQRDTIVFLARVSWGATAGHAALELGTAPGVIDIGLNMWTRNVISRGRDTGPLGNSDAGLFFGTKEISAKRWLLQGTTDNGGVQSRIFLVTINNGLTVPKTASWLMARSTGLAATNGPISSGWGEYVSPNAGIRCVRLVTADGSANLAAESGFGIFGRNQVNA